MNEIHIESKRKERELAIENRKMQGRGRKRPREGIIMRWGINLKIKGEKKKNL